jgi:hypothetical protein
VQPAPSSEPTEEELERGVQGRIVTSQPEGEGMVLFLDKGSRAGVRIGQKGAVLDGPAGSSPLAGGSFEITKVVDESRCVARTPLRSLGRNRRVAVVTSR